MVKKRGLIIKQIGEKCRSFDGVCPVSPFKSATVRRQSMIYKPVMRDHCECEIEFAQIFIRNFDEIIRSYGEGAKNSINNYIDITSKKFFGSVANVVVIKQGQFSIFIRKRYKYTFKDTLIHLTGKFYNELLTRSVAYGSFSFHILVEIKTLFLNIHRILYRNLEYGSAFIGGYCARNACFYSDSNGAARYRYDMAYACSTFSAISEDIGNSPNSQNGHTVVIGWDKIINAINDTSKCIEFYMLRLFLVSKNGELSFLSKNDTLKKLGFALNIDIILLKKVVKFLLDNQNISIGLEVSECALSCDEFLRKIIRIIPTTSRVRNRLVILIDAEWAAANTAQSKLCISSLRKSGIKINIINLKLSEPMIDVALLAKPDYVEICGSVIYSCSAKLDYRVLHNIVLKLRASRIKVIIGGIDLEEHDVIAEAFDIYLKHGKFFGSRSIGKPWIFDRDLVIKKNLQARIVNFKTWFNINGLIEEIMAYYADHIFCRNKNKSFRSDWKMQDVGDCDRFIEGELKNEFTGLSFFKGLGCGIILSIPIWIFIIVILCFIFGGIRY